jgi:hypothetical protein
MSPCGSCSSMACPSLPSGHEAAEAGAVGKVLIDIDG